MKFTSLSLVTGIAVSGIVATGAFTPAHAATLLTSEVGYTGLRINLETPAYKTSTNNYTAGPNNIEYTNALKNNTITFTATTGPIGGSTLGQNEPGLNYLLGTNGKVSDKPVFAGIDQNVPGPYSMSFSFATPVQQFGAFLNYAPNVPAGYNTPNISAITSTGKLISYDLETTPGGKISTPGQTDVFLFRGIDAGSDLISSFTLTGGNIVAAGLPYNLPASTAVPEPFTIIGTLVGGSAALRMRKKLKSTKV
jgi:hypothetical protein